MYPLRKESVGLDIVKIWPLLFALLPLLIPKVGLMVPLFLIAVKLGAFDSRIFLIIVFRQFVCRERIRAPFRAPLLSNQRR